MRSAVSSMKRRSMQLRTSASAFLLPVAKHPSAGKVTKRTSTVTARGEAGVIALRERHARRPHETLRAGRGRPARAAVAADLRAHRRPLLLHLDARPPSPL